MELLIEGAPDSFHCGKALGTALLNMAEQLATLTGATHPLITRRPEPGAFVPDATCDWKIENYRNVNPDGLILITGSCPRCHQSVQLGSPNAALKPWFHCARSWSVPQDLLEKYEEIYNAANKQPARRFAVPGFGPRR